MSSTKSWVAASIGAVVLAGLEACCITSSASQPVTLVGQETSMWCWAASGEMCMDFLGTDVTQCDQANHRFGRTDCCGTGRPSDCVQGGWPDFDHYGFDAVRTNDAPLSWTKVQRELACADRPFAFTWHWDGGGGHMMVAYGYVDFFGGIVMYNDPWPPGEGDQTMILYTGYVEGPGYTHWDDFHDLVRR